ncbi:hypothetical protein WJ96_07690 [Burkholderia ubonensis]|uniref:RES domain-containing protein n=2 Tax=Burkholderia ubonensis TaxID=101571 RepID=A0AAW3MUG9_9BURK|nr:hypothetical protein WJ93_09490 [Burkholderia ubonensis]KVP97044.1 hypothetical protein WJ97_14595 [Burkholderia ubonensis]KVP98394.1 hypothetical protein WJ96_07690 [Burkholderia ubonensis]KVZ93093.1 hypothetical protein WL25_19355 [Burkholderia ubonensis]
MWHGGRRWTERPAVQPPKQGRYECGPGIYLTNQYERAKHKYARGNGVTTLVSLKSDIAWLERKALPLQDMQEYIRQTRGFRKRDLLLAELDDSASRLGRELIPASYLVNLCVNNDVLSGSQGVSLAAWLVEQGIDASLHTVNLAEQWVIVFNPLVIEHYRAVPAALVSLEQYNLPLVNLPAQQ